jgi:hypothetical protein
MQGNFQSISPGVHQGMVTTGCKDVNALQVGCCITFCLKQGGCPHDCPHMSQLAVGSICQHDGCQELQRDLHNISFSTSTSSSVMDISSAQQILSHLSIRLQPYKATENQCNCGEIPSNLCNDIRNKLVFFVKCARKSQQAALSTSFLFTYLQNPGLHTLLQQGQKPTANSAVQQILEWLYALSLYLWTDIDPTMPTQIEEATYHIHRVNNMGPTYLKNHLRLLILISISPVQDVTEKRLYFLRSLVVLDCAGSTYAMHKVFEDPDRCIEGFIVLAKHGLEYHSSCAAIASFIDKAFPAFPSPSSKRRLIKTVFPSLWVSLTLALLTSGKAIDWETIKLHLDIIYNLLNAGPVATVASSGDSLARIMIRSMRVHNSEVQAKVIKISQLLLKVAWYPSVARNIGPALERYGKRHQNSMEESIHHLIVALVRGQVERKKWLAADNGTECSYIYVRLFFFSNYLSMVNY